MPSVPPLLDDLLRTLIEEEAALNRLLSLALEEQSALVKSDFKTVEQLSERMSATAEALDRLEQRREQLMESLGQAGCSFEELAMFADNHGVDGFGNARKRLGDAARELREAQECNANLILGAMRVRERWVGMLAGLDAPTYGSGGQQELNQERGFVSRSA